MELTAEALSSMPAAQVLRLAGEAGIDKDRYPTRAAMEAALLEAPEPEAPEAPAFEPAPLPVAASPIPEEVEEQVEQTAPVDVDEEITIDKAAAMLVEDHVQSTNVTMSANHRRAVAEMCVRIMNLDETIGPEDFTFVTSTLTGSSLHSQTLINLPGADGCARVIAAGRSGENAQASVKWGRVRRRHRHLG